MTNFFILFLIKFVHSEACFEHLEQGSYRSFPHLRTRVGAVDGQPARFDHAIGNLHEELRHPFRRVEEPGDGVDHLEGVHERRDGVDDLGRCS